MSIRVWLNSAGEKALEQREPNVTSPLKVGDRLLRADMENGHKYVYLVGSPNDPATVFPQIPRKLIRKVTFVDRFYVGFRTDGVYTHKGATARVETRKNYRGQGDQLEVYQEISISAGSIRAVTEIYKKIRMGELKPCANWEARQA